MEVIDNQLENLKVLKLTSMSLRKKYDLIEDEVVRDEVKKIIILLDKIYEEVLVNSGKISKIKKFFNFYIPSLEKVLEKYIRFKEKKLKGTEVDEYFKNVENFLKQVSESFDKIYNSLFTDEIFDVDTEIKVLLKEMRL